MVFQFQYEWEIENADEIENLKLGESIFSPFFHHASPCQMTHSWQVELRRDRKYPDYYSVYLYLKDSPFFHNVDRKYDLNIFNIQSENMKQFSMKEFRRIEEKSDKGWGWSEAIRFNEGKNMKKMCLDIKLVCVNQEAQQSREILRPTRSVPTL